jgi:hypothetical protein
MTVLLHPTAVRALLLAALLACAAAFLAPAARGAESGEPAASAAASQIHPAAYSAGSPGVVLAEDFSWNEFVKFWSRQAGSMSGVVGTVLLVAALAVLIIMSKGRG